ncbi:MAG: hypothetical protein IPM29_04510 [Planctomycetes bacterium]|nr:hypothetical protein [Planctomycetota bacterium]
MADHQDRIVLKSLAASGRVDARNRGWALALRPVWHPDATGGHRCAAIETRLTIALHFTDEDGDSTAIRQALESMLSTPVELRAQAQKLMVRGVIVSLRWSQQVDADGASNASTAMLDILGTEPTP